MTADPGSFRDPSGHVYRQGECIYRTVTQLGLSEYRAVQESGVLEGLVNRGLVIASTEVSGVEISGVEPDTLVLEHPCLPVISYPYEWPFRALKDAALLHLDIQLELLEHDIALSDASAFNIQFQGARPIFIDRLSFRRYRPNEPWLAHRQFCDQFLNPLILQGVFDVPFHGWYRGTLEGISAREIWPLLRWRHKLSPLLFSHVALPAKWERAAHRKDLGAVRSKRKKGLKRSHFRAILQQLRHYISRLAPVGFDNTTWSGYAADNTYDDAGAGKKRAFIGRFAAEVRPDLLVDLGCNDGTYTAVALANGAQRAVGLDVDHGALDAAYRRATANGLDFLPLYQNLANPTPDQGWNRLERPSLASRLGAADGVQALALVHHLAIACNVPLDQVVGAVVATAPQGVIEYVPKDDPTIETMLALRDDVFPDYTREAFIAALEARAEIVDRETVSASGRELFRFRRR